MILYMLYNLCCVGLPKVRERMEEKSNMGSLRPDSGKLNKLNTVEPEERGCPLLGGTRRERLSTSRRNPKREAVLFSEEPEERGCPLLGGTLSEEPEERGCVLFSEVPLWSCQCIR